ncbi:MAG: MFS transporter [Candidatus Competibacteraceae bacterium]|nr:MFS transporter [Candidatus Competibacteraceae bacterium]
MTSKSAKSPLIVIFFTVFLYLAGFGLIIPILPLLGKELGGSAKEIGMLMAVYSLMQFVFAPMWGRLSDCYGRRPILLFCLFGEALTYIWFAYSRDFGSLFAARAFAGFFGASISTASAYVSDITTESERSKGMALIGAAFGLGFIVGPALGGGLIAISAYFSTDPYAGSQFAALFVAFLYGVTFYFAYGFLTESLPPEKRRIKKPRIEQPLRLPLTSRLGNPVLTLLITLFFFLSVSIAMMETTLVLLVNEKFGWPVDIISYGFAYVGFIMVIAQGFLVPRLLPSSGERLLSLLGLGMLGLGMLGIASAQGIFGLLGATTFLALGCGFATPALMGSISLVSSEQEQGTNLGVAQSASSLGRIVGPVLGGFLYDSWAAEAPFAVAALIAFLGALIIISLFQRLPNSGKSA